MGSPAGSPSTITTSARPCDSPAVRNLSMRVRVPPHARRTGTCCPTSVHENARYADEIVHRRCSDVQVLEEAPTGLAVAGEPGDGVDDAEHGALALVGRQVPDLALHLQLALVGA